jgi:hypothetical protein
MSDCPHPVRKYDAEGDPYCGQCGEILLPHGYDSIPEVGE